MSALAEAFGHRSYVLLVFGFFTCGFQLAFITLHLPAYLIDRGLSAQVGGWALATIGLFNIIGSISVGWLATRYPRRYLLAINYFLRAVFIAAFVLLPASPVTTLLFARRHGPDVALDRSADLRPRLADVRHALARDALRLRVLQPPGRRLPRRLDGRPAVRAHRLLRHCVVACGRVRHIVGGDQSADRGEARAAGCSPPPPDTLRPAPEGRREWRRTRSDEHQSSGWRTPAVILAVRLPDRDLTFGPRSTFGFFLQPMSQELGWGRDVFALAVAIQNLL